MSTRQFEGIYLNQSRGSGKLRIAESGLGWKVSETAAGGGSSASTEPFLLPSDEILTAYWSRGARNYQLRLQTKNKGVTQLDGFDPEDLNALKNSFKNNFDINVEPREHSLRGWNWGAMDFEQSEMVFNVAGKPMFEVPYSDVSNTNIVGKSEVAVELALPSAGERLKAGDELVEMRFFVPGIVPKDEPEDDKAAVKKENGDGVEVKEEVKEEGEGEGESESEAHEEEAEEEINAVQVFYESLKEKAEIGLVAGEAIVTFSDILFLTPRGRYDIDMYPTSFRLRGKTYDYKIQYKNVQRLFVLPKPDEIHHILVVQLDPPLRQGQTRYPFLIMQFLREEELEVELNVEEEEFNEKYAEKLDKSYDEAAHQVVAKLFKGLSNRKLTFPSSYKTTAGQAGVACSLKASEGYLFPLDKCFLFIPKPTVYIPLAEIGFISFSRIGGSTSRTFDMTIHLRSSTTHQFSNISREERQSLEGYIKSKGMKLKKEGGEQQAAIAAALAAGSSDDDDEAMNSANDEDESDDEDFEAGDESDVAEEFDSNAGSSDEEMAADDDSDSDTGTDSEPPLKKTKT